MESWVLERVKEILVERMGIVPGEVTVDANLRDDLGLDSLDLFELLTYLEEQLDIEIDEEEARSMHTVRDVVVFVEAHQSTQPAES